MVLASGTFASVKAGSDERNKGRIRKDGTESGLQLSKRFNFFNEFRRVATVQNQPGCFNPRRTSPDAFLLK